MHEDDEWLNMQSITFDLKENRIVQLEECPIDYQKVQFRFLFWFCDKGETADSTAIESLRIPQNPSESLESLRIPQNP